MARKRREPTPPPPPPPPPQEESSSEESSSGEEEEEAPQKPPQNPKPPSTAAANDDDADESSDGSDEEQGEGRSDGSDEEQGEGDSSDSEIDAEAFQLRQVDRSPSKPSAAPPKLESGADEEEEGESSDDPEPVEKKAAMKLKAEAGKKRLAPEPAPSGKAKKAKATVENAVPEPTQSGMAKKAKPGAEKTVPELTPSGKANKLKAEPEKTAVDPLSSSKSGKKKWMTKDEIRILEAAVGHVKTKGTKPNTADLIATLGDSLDRKKCSYSEMYEKVRQLKQRYERAVSTGALPSEGDELYIYKLSEAIWRENLKEVALDSISQKDGASSKSKKGQINKEKMDTHSKGGTSKEVTTVVNENVGTQAGSKNGQTTKGKIDAEIKSGSSKKPNTIDIPAKNKKHGKHKEGPVEDAKTGASKEITAAATEEKMDEDTEGHGPKEATIATQNGGTLTESEYVRTHEGMDVDANVQGIRKGLTELQHLYPNLTSYVESIKDQHPCGETLMRAFQFIDDQKASALESKIQKQRVAEVKMEIRRDDTKKELINILIGLLD